MFPHTRAALSHHFKGTEDKDISGWNPSLAVNDTSTCGALGTACRLLHRQALDEVFSIQSEIKLSKQLTFHYKNQLYLLIQKKSVMGLRGQRIDILEAADGTLTVKHGQRTLAVSGVSATTGGLDE